MTGIFGGFVHDVIQNKKAWQRYKKTDEGYYLGSVTALILGFTSGLLVSLLLPDTTTLSMAAYTGLTAGLSLKGIAEAAATKQAE